MITALAVIPGAGMEQPENAAGNVFHEKNQNRINRSPQKDTRFFQIAGNNRNQCSESVYGKHKKRGLADQSFIIGSSQVMEAGEKKFHRPSDEAAADKICFKIFQ